METKAPALYLPLKAPMRVRGVLAVELGDASAIDRCDLHRVLDACASLLAISLERIHYVNVAQQTTVQVESQRLRNSVLAAISHDLRTPLTALVGMADSLSLPQPEGGRVETARAIRDAAFRLNAQVGKLLDMARLQSGQVRLDRQWLPLEEVLGSALRGLEGCLAPERVHVDLPSALPMLHVDATLFERVLWNLLENAAKYTPPGSPIEVHGADEGDVVRISVADRGPGLPRQREAAMFQMFERGRKEDATPGVGLGLAICRAIVEAHGGTIVGQTRASGGARFTIELPRGTPPGIDAPAVQAVLPAAA
jgi:two-component system sensor histidine kinase KdpD